MDFESNLNKTKLLYSWAFIIALAVLPWLVPLLTKGGSFVIFAIFIDMFCLLVLLLTKITLKVTILSDAQIIERYWTTLWGKKGQTNINIGEVSVTLYRKPVANAKNELLSLTVLNRVNPANKFNITEISDGFDAQQLKQMYKLLTHSDFE